MSRKGLRVKTDEGVHDDVRLAIKNLASWLRGRYDFPIRLPIYIKSATTIKSAGGIDVSAKFFAPFDRNEEPYITIATGGYASDVSKFGIHDSLASVLHSVLHEILHYNQWINGEDLNEDGIECAADKLLEDYATDAQDPLYPIWQ